MLKCIVESDERERVDENFVRCLKLYKEIIKIRLYGGIQALYLYYYYKYYTIYIYIYRLQG